MRRTAPASSTTRPAGPRRPAAASLLGLLGLGLVLGACQTTLPEVHRLPKQSDALSASRERFMQDAGDMPVRRVRVARSSMQSRTVKQGVSPALRARPLSIQFPSIDATVNELVDAMSAANIQIAFRWQTPKAEDLLKRKLPFPRYAGTVGGLLDALRTGLGIVAWQEGQTIFLSDAERYAVALPQNEDVLKNISTTLKDLGATEVVSSLEGGKIIYSATPSLQDEIIGPFMHRTARNLSTITLQVAIVSLAVNDKSAQGFDWSKLGINLDSRADALANASRAGKATETATGVGTGTGTGTGTGIGTNTGVNSGLGGLGTGQQQAGNPVDSLFGVPSTLQKGTVGGISKEDILLGTTLTPKILGVKTAFTVAGAIDWLSTFGNTNVTQNVELRTLSGKQVKIRSGQEIPYVKGVGVNSTGSTVANNQTSGGLGGALGSTQTDTVKTGLTVEMLPRFDADAELVTCDIKMELKSVLEFVQLSAGNQIGTLTQPRTQEQELTDIVRLRAGQTAVIGGIQYDQEQFDGNEPTVVRQAFGEQSSSFGRRAQDVQRNALFIILRPVVTVYDTDDSGPDAADLPARITK